MREYAGGHCGRDKLLGIELCVAMLCLNNISLVEFIIFIGCRMIVQAV